jgi:hypothetical protein
MRHWWVSTPEFGVMVPLLDDGTGPLEYQCDVVCVDAATRREAIVAGVKKMRAEGAKWFESHDGNPFVGIKAESARCEHGELTCDCAGEAVCEKCEEAIDRAHSLEMEAEWFQGYINDR